MSGRADGDIKGSVIKLGDGVKGANTSGRRDGMEACSYSMLSLSITRRGNSSCTTSTLLGGGIHGKVKESRGERRMNCGD